MRSVSFLLEIRDYGANYIKGFRGSLQNDTTKSAKSASVSFEQYWRRLSSVSVERNMERVIRHSTCIWVRIMSVG